MGTTFITGAGRGLGLEFARQLCAKGETVIGTVRKESARGELEAVGARALICDVDDQKSVEACVAELGGEALDCLINNAGVYGKRQSLDELDTDEIQRVFRINAVAPLRVSRALLPNLETGKARKVIQVTSKMGSIDDNTSGGSYAYRMSKAALNMMNRSLSHDLAERGFTCLVLHPGWVQTDMGGENAPLTPEQSVAGMLQVIGQAAPTDSGCFFNYTGDRIPW